MIRCRLQLGSPRRENWVRLCTQLAAFVAVLSFSLDSPLSRNRMLGIRIPRYAGCVYVKCEMSEVRTRMSGKQRRAYKWLCTLYP